MASNSINGFDQKYLQESVPFRKLGHITNLLEESAVSTTFN